jgi:predicted PurR-regulated permease PerM
MSIPGSNPAALPRHAVINYALQLLALSLLLIWCFRILEPFITPLVWGSVLAITLYPLHAILSRKLKGRTTWSAVIITVMMLLLLIGPGVWLLLATVDEFKILGDAYRSGNLHIPPPSDQVKEWPLVGSTVYENWSQASKDITALLVQYREEVKSVLLKLFDLFKNTATGILLFGVSVIVGGVLLAYAKAAGDFARSLFIQLVGKTGESMVESAEITVRNVAKGVLGVALIQSILAGIGLVLAGIPFAGLWILVCMILAIVQIGLLPVSVGVIIYIWSSADTLTATLLTIWMIFVGVIDNVLRPIMLGKGAPVPMLVIFIGSLGGFMASGFIGLFTGAIVLTLGYKLVTMWLRGDAGTKQEIL